MYTFIYSINIILFITIRCNSCGLELNAIIVVQFWFDIIHQVQNLKHDLDCKRKKESKYCNFSHTIVFLYISFSI